MTAEAKEMQNKIKELKQQLFDLNIDIVHMNRGANKQPLERREFVRACPAGDCRGFLSTNWKCGLCSAHVCKDCHEVKTGEEEHVCNPDMLETARMLAQDSKHCPKCSAVIFKVDGCDQMWCTQCFTAFDWRTLRIETGRIHNPHFYAWMRAQSENGEIPREEGDNNNACGQGRDQAGPPYFAYVNAKLQKLGPLPAVNVAWAIYRCTIHINNVELTRYQRRQQVDFLANIDIRKRYMKGDMDKDAFQALLQQRDKKQRKHDEIRQVFDLFVQVCSERIRQPLTTTTLQEYVTEAENLRVYSNTAFAETGARFNGVYPIIAPTWEIVSVRGHLNVPRTR
jgi:hypothetical protein